MKRVLMVAYHYPPCRGSSGLQRTLSFSKTLPSLQWYPVVLTVRPEAYEQTGEDQLADIPSNVVVQRTFALDTARHLAFKKRYPGFLAVPDRWISWVLWAVPSAIRLIRRHRIQVIWSTYPIATAHLIGFLLHSVTKLPWVADFRDPMVEYDPVTRQQWPSDPKIRRARSRIERMALNHAAQCVFVASGARQIYADRYPHADGRMTIIPNGYDEDSFVSAERLVRTSDQHGSPITLLHSGVLYSSPDRNPSELFAALSWLRASGLVSPQSLNIVLRASGNEQLYRDLIARHNIEGLVALKGMIPYREALAEMMSVQGLLLFQGHDSNPAVPAKLYEYFRARKPIFALVDAEGDTARTLRQHGVGCIVPLTSAEQIAEGLMAFLDEIRRGAAPILTEEAVAQYSRKAQTQQLAQLFDSVLDHREHSISKMR